jgi:hypothetical protein
MIKNFRNDLAFLQQHTDTIVLGQPGQAALVLAPAYQGRVMTSTAGGAADHSFGWINYDLIRQGQVVPQINLYGGEERFWLAPEGGRFSIFFPPASLHDPLDFATWRVPTCIDTDPFTVVEVGAREVTFAHQSHLQNRFGTEFHLGFERRVQLLDEAEVAAAIHCDVSSLHGVPYIAHQSENTLRNLGDVAWQPETGLMSVWVLGMHAPSPQATLIVPYQSDGVRDDEPLVNADYFGTLGPDRLKVDRERQVVLLRGDGQFRSKLGLTYPRAKPFLAAWDQQRQVFTLIQFNLPAMKTVDVSTSGRRADGLVQSPDRIAYVNNLWRVLDDEYRGDVSNGYNDGPNESGGKLGGFFELESLRPALALAPQQAYTHVHFTLHMEATDAAAFAKVDGLCQRLCGVSLTELEFES